MPSAFIGIGANLGDRKRSIEDALRLLDAHAGLDVVAVSAIRETEPVGVVDQPRFLNAAAKLETRLSPRQLLDRLLGVERELGRVRVERYGPRTIDLDLLVYGDELDEFEADLELRLKREYSAVFGLFRFCVLTQDATYLCNKLDLNYAPQPSYPFYHLKMEDVWVWDKNRPTRIVPKAEIYTSSDVTVEELTREGEEPKLTAEALAERIGES